MSNTINKAWPSEDRIAIMHQDDVFNIVGRDWCKFRTGDCNHPIMTCVEVGPWFVNVCDYCGHTQSQCLHPENEWNEAGTLLRCKTCGVDGT